MVKAILSKEEFGSIDKAWQGEYSPQDDGSYVLKVEPVGGVSLGKVEGAVRALDVERTARQAAEASLKQFVDDDGKPLDPSKAKSHAKKVAEMKDWKPEDKVREQIEHLKEEMQGEWGKERKALQEKIDLLESGLNKSVVNAGLMAAIAERKANPLLADLLRPRIKPEFDPATKEFVPRVIGDDGNPRYELVGTEMKPMGIPGLIKSVEKEERYAPFFPGSGASGTGGLSPGRPSSAGRPFTMSKAEASGPDGVQRYQRLRSEAAKAGQTVQIVE